MKSNTIKTVLVTLLVVMLIGLLAESEEKSKEKENKYKVETSTSEHAVKEELDNEGFLTKDELIDKIMQIMHNSWEYSDFEYYPDNDVIDIHIGNPSDTNGINAIQYSTKLKEKWEIETQPSVKSLNLVLLDVFRSHGYQTHVNLYYHNGFQHEKTILLTMDGMVVYDYFLNIDVYGVSN